MDIWYKNSIKDYDLQEPDYSFDIIGITRRDPDGKLFWSTDSGCSCPSPWESHTEADWKPLPETWSDFERSTKESRVGE